VKQQRNLFRVVPSVPRRRCRCSWRASTPTAPPPPSCHCNSCTGFFGSGVILRAEGRHTAFSGRRGLHRGRPG
jgi:hypothetical protein